jgi:hypothetical protein
MTRQLSGRDGFLRQTRAAIGPYNIELDGEPVGRLRSTRSDESIELSRLP